ncbi:hypothetical protein BH10ACT5_BH10ACT5_18880 [soil metagenome]
MSEQTSPKPLHIVQIAPDIAPGSGVAGVASALEREFIAKGVSVERFTLAEARGPRSLRAGAGKGLARHLAAAWAVVWFSTVGTARARTFLSARPDAVSICHNDVMAGDIYVNHGLVQPAMRARGHYGWRMLRNPVHLFTVVRDRVRYGWPTHRAIVALTRSEAKLLRATYRKVAAPITVIPNGVDLERFRPPTPAERTTQRAALGLPAKAIVSVFVGHEFDRKGLPLAIDALRSAPEANLLVIGGTAESIGSAQAFARQRGLDDRVVFAGAQPDPAPMLRAADLLILPSAYEANALVLLEALATGLPVISTRVGFAPELIVDGANGYLVERDADEIGERLRELAGRGLRDRSAQARRTAERYSWAAVADRYIELAESVRSAAARIASVEGSPASTMRILHAIRSDGFAGVEQFVLRLACAQAAAGHHVHVIGGDPAQMRQPLADLGIAFTPAARTIAVATALRRLRRHVNVINTHMTAADLGAAFGLFGVRARPAVVATRHFAKPRGRIGPLPIDRLVRSTVDAEIAISAAVAASIGTPSTVVHSGVDARPVPDQRLRERTVLMAQRLEREKATDVGIQAFAASGLASQGWLLEIAGRGTDEDALRRLVDHLDIADAVRFLGFRSDVTELMARAGMLLAPCPNEGLGLTVLEAMAAALPVVAADAGGHSELLADLDDRALFAAGDVDAAAAHLRSLAQDSAARAELGVRERKRQRTQFTPRQQAGGTFAVYRETIAARAGRAGTKAGDG